MRKFLIFGLLDLYSALSRFSLSWVFWFIPGELICMWHIGNSTAEGQHHAMHDFIFQHCKILWIFISFGSQSDWSIIDYLTKSAHLCYSEWVSLLKFWQCSFIRRHQISTITAPSEDVYIRQKGRDVSVLSLPFSRLGRTAHSYSYLDWHNPHSHPFCVHLPLIEIARTQFFYKVDGV